MSEKNENTQTKSETSQYSSNLKTRNTGADDTLNDIESLDESFELTKKGRGANKEYLMQESFQDYKMALHYVIENLKEYKFRYSRPSKEGQKRFYHCVGFHKCPCTIYLLKHSDSQECSIWKADTQHKHNTNASNRLPKKTIELVQQCIKDGIRSNKRIIEKIKANKLQQITKNQLKNLKARIKDNKFGKTEGTLSELINWCQKNEEIPDDEDKVFCGSLDYNIDEYDELVDLRIFLKTKRLISFTKKR